MAPHRVISPSYLSQNHCTTAPATITTTVRMVGYEPPSEMKKNVTELYVLTQKDLQDIASPEKLKLLKEIQRVTFIELAHFASPRNTQNTIYFLQAYMYKHKCKEESLGDDTL